MRVPYFIVKQKNEEFFVMKFLASELKSKLDFHFREPYSNTNKEKISCDKYIDKLKKKGLDITSEQEGVQRRVQLSRINKISAYLEGQEDSYFPNTVVLSADVSMEEKFMKDVLENPDLPYAGEIDLPDSISFQIVDGQHRLAGLYISDEVIQKNFEIFAVVLFNATKHTCAKIFRDINGNQASVNKSGLFDLLDLIEIDASEEDLLIDKNVHLLCKKFNDDNASPLYGHIKMMGIGSGAISQAFFVERTKKALKDAGLDVSKEENIQKIYTHLFYYFSAFQRVFPNDWPVITEQQYNAGKLDTNFMDETPGLRTMEFGEIREKYSMYILKTKKSQLLKTNGFGAVLKLFPIIERDLLEYEFANYLAEVKKLEGKIDWSKDEDLISGTGVKIINKISDRMIKFL